MTSENPGATICYAKVNFSMTPAKIFGCAVNLGLRYFSWWFTRLMTVQKIV